MPEVAPGGFTFNQYLLDGDEPLLFHTGPRRMFPLVSEAVAKVLPLDRLRWVSFGHVEADECGAMNQWLAAAPYAQVLFNALGCMVSVDDLADRPPRPSPTTRPSTSAATAARRSSPRTSRTAGRRR